MNRPPSLWRAKVEERALRPPTEPNSNPDVAPSTVGESTDEPGDPDGFMILGDAGGDATFTGFTASPWSGWPAEWATPLLNPSGRFGQLVDVAWAGLDLNARNLATMPPYRLRGGEILPATSWMQNPDPDLYTGWIEFAKQLFWGYLLGEAFVLTTARDANGYPARFHCVEPWLVNAELDGSGLRRYAIGTLDVTDDMLHIRYHSSTSNARGTGPLEVGHVRMVAAAALARYATNLAGHGGVPHYVLKHARQLTTKQADDLLHQWWEARSNHLGLPGVLSGGVELEAIQMSPKDMGLVDLAQHIESRIAMLLGIPAFMLGLPSGGDSMTYSNVTSLFDHHWRASLRTFAAEVTEALSGWLLPRGQTLELNRDEYVRPGFGERVTAWATLHGLEDETGRAVTAEEIRRGERLNGAGATAILTGGATEWPQP